MTESQLDAQISSYVRGKNLQTKIAEYEQLLSLLADGAVDVGYNQHGRKVAPCIVINDFWGYCTDTQPFELHQVWEVTDMWVKYGHYGLLAWVGVNRGIEPGSSLYSPPRDLGEDYCEAWYYFSNLKNTG